MKLLKTVIRHTVEGAVIKAVLQSSFTHTPLFIANAGYQLLNSKRIVFILNENDLMVIGDSGDEEEEAREFCSMEGSFDDLIGKTIVTYKQLHYEDGSVLLELTTDSGVFVLELDNPNEVYMSTRSDTETALEVKYVYKRQERCKLFLTDKTGWAHAKFPILAGPLEGLVESAGDILVAMTRPDAPADLLVAVNDYYFNAGYQVDETGQWWINTTLNESPTGYQRKFKIIQLPKPAILMRQEATRLFEQEQFHQLLDYNHPGKIYHTVGRTELGLPELVFVRREDKFNVGRDNSYIRLIQENITTLTSGENTGIPLKMDENTTYDMSVTITDIPWQRVLNARFNYITLFQRYGDKFELAVVSAPELVEDPLTGKMGFAPLEQSPGYKMFFS